MVARNLFLVEKGAEPLRSVRLIQSKDLSEDALVLVEDSKTLSGFEKNGREIHSLNEGIPHGGQRDGVLWEEAVRLVEKEWLSEPLFSAILGVLGSDAFFADEATARFNLITVAHHFTKTVHQLLLRIAVLREVLPAENWARVYLLESEGELGKAFDVVSSETGFEGNVTRLAMRNYRDMARSVRNRWLRGHPCFSLGGRWGADVLLKLPEFLTRRRIAPSLRSLSSADGPLFLTVVSDSKVYVDTVISVLNELPESARAVALGGKSVKTRLQAHGVKVLNWNLWVPPSAWPRMLRADSQLRSLLLRLESAVGRSLPHPAARSFWSAVKTPVEKLFRLEILRLGLWNEALKCLFDSLQPSALLVVPDRSALGRASIAVARHQGIPSLYVQPSVLSDHPRYGPLHADKAALMNDYCCQVLVRRGQVEPERLVITGLPRWDPIQSITRESALRVLQGIPGLESGARYLVFASQVVAASYVKRLLRLLVKNLAGHRGLRLVIKVHPSDSAETYKAILRQLEYEGSEVIVLDRVDLHPLLLGSELVITWFSSVALEAVLLDKPVLIVNLSGEPDPLPYLQEGIVLGAYSEEEFKQQLDRILKDKAVGEELGRRRAAYRRRNPQLCDGKAAQRAAHLLLEMSGHSPDSPVMNPVS